MEERGNGQDFTKVVNGLNWKSEVERYKFQEGLSWTETARKVQHYFPDLTEVQVREKIRVPFRKYKHNTRPNAVQSKFIIKGDMFTYEDTLEVIDGREITPEIIMQAHKLKPEEWQVVSFCSNVWQQQTKGGGKINLCQSKLTVRPKVKTEITFEDIDNFFKTADFRRKKPLQPFEYNDSDEILEINYTDLHVGLLAWRAETGKDFDLDIIEQRFKESISDILRRCKGRTFKLIRFVTLGDIIHIDNDEQKTTKGTFQQADGRMAKIFDRAADLMMYALDALLELKSPIEYVYTSGNHDRNTGYFLAHTIRSTYKDEPNIKFDILPNPQKAKIYGKYLVGYCHGDMPRKNMGEWLLKDFRREYGETQYAEIHSGHVHHESVKEINSIKVITLPTLCESSYWEHQQGYRAERALICYVWHERYGKRETWINQF